MPSPRDVLTPDALALLQTVMRTGSFAAAARDTGMVPSAITYRVRQIEDALDVLLFDRSSRQARLTPAGHELLREGEHLLQAVDAVANRVRRVATGWESQLTISLDGVVAMGVMLELAQAFYAVAPRTHLRIRTETLSGTLEALLAGEADLAIGVPPDALGGPGIQLKPLADVEFVFVVAPDHPLAACTAPITDEERLGHRAVAVADTGRRGRTMTLGLLAGQDVLTVPTLWAKIDAQRRGLGAGFVPEPMVRSDVRAGRLVQKEVARPPRIARMGYAWHSGPGDTGLALQWWLKQLESAVTRRALLEQHEER